MLPFLEWVGCRQAPDVLRAGWDWSDAADSRIAGGV